MTIIRSHVDTVFQQVYTICFHLFILMQLVFTSLCILGQEVMEDILLSGVGSGRYLPYQVHSRVGLCIYTEVTK